jgi:hypothetical protein
VIITAISAVGCHGADKLVLVAADHSGDLAAEQASLLDSLVRIAVVLDLHRFTGEQMLVGIQGDHGVVGVTNDEAKVYVNNENVVVFGEAQMIEIYNVGGQLIESAQVESLSSFDINHLATGAYIIKVIAADEVVTLKHVK